MEQTFVTKQGDIALTRVYLIRHGETEWNKTGKLQGHSNVSLSREGVRQAQLLAEHMPFHTVDAIYSSDLSRAVKTAEILAKQFNLPVIQNSGFREMNFGDWEGRKLSELAAEMPVGFEHFFTRPDKVYPPHGETFLEAQSRVLNTLDKVITDHEDQSVIIVSHGAIIRLLLCAILGMPIRKMWAISQFNMAVNIFLVDDGNFTVELLNSTLHLYNF